MFKERLLRHNCDQLLKRAIGLVDSAMLIENADGVGDDVDGLLRGHHQLCSGRQVRRTRIHVHPSPLLGPEALQTPQQRPDDHARVRAGA